MLTLAVAGRKGGVGKTSVTVTLADDLAHRYGYRVCVIDLDPQANATQWLDVTVAPGETLTSSDALYSASTPGALDDAVTETGWEQVWCVPAETALASREADRAAAADMRLRRCIETSSLARWADVVLLDTPPGLGPLLHNGLNAADTVLGVTDSERGGVNGVAELLDTVTALSYTNTRLTVGGLVMTKWDSRSREHDARWDEIASNYPDHRRWRIPGRVAVANAFGASIPPRDAPRAGAFVLALREITDAILDDAKTVAA